VRWTGRHISLAGLRVWQQAETNDRFGRGIHAAVSTSHSAERIRSHPSLRRSGQLPAIRVYRSVSETPGDDSSGSIAHYSTFQPLLALRSLSDALDSYRKAHCRPTLLAPFNASVHRLFLSRPPTSFHDVLMHACADVCFRWSSEFWPAVTAGIPKPTTAHMSFRGGVRLIRTAPLAKTSTRISVLSP